MRKQLPHSQSHLVSGSYLDWKWVSVQVAQGCSQHEKAGTVGLRPAKPELGEKAKERLVSVAYRVEHGWSGQKVERTMFQLY